ncbi:hypothetical protein AGLY_003340 [Aphis glycines]|uniref:Uncharacterized protein n=1 Tax=Aphis glycines TaxID=307491 RepID=A0A6G0U1H9_APHGL|nr:hypothetical protein AGLY_003340 [Aphis glycines]
MAVVEALEKNVDDYVINRTSIQRCRQILRKERASLIKDKFLESDLQAVVLHWDGKLLPNLVGKDIMDRLSIVISSGDIEKILSIPVLQNSTANEQAKVIYKTLIEWNIQNSVRALSFDTTAVNSGRLGGTCVLLERLLKKELFYLPCRHHIYEIILRSIFDKKLNISTGKDVPIFKRFQHSWNKIDKYDFSPGILDEKIKGIINPHLTRVLEFVKEHLKILQPRNDYKELLELTMIFLGDKPNNTIFFHTPGAIHHARWMAKAIYCLKIFMFRTSFELTISEEDGLRDICIFIVTIYIEAWFKAPSAAAAPYQDLLFIRKLYNYSSNDDDISRVALHKFRNHLWYLTPEAVALAFFDKTISNESKRKMIIKLNCKTHSNEKIKRLSLKESEIPEFVKKEIEFFVTSRTLDFFKIFNLDTEFLLNDPSDWSENFSFQNAFKTISKLKTVNDTAERGIKLIEDYNSILTTNEEQKQFVLQIVSDYRKIFPDCKKQTLKRKLEKKGEFLGYLCDMIQREKHNVTTFLRRDEAPSCLRSHMENANKKLSEAYSKSELERYTKNITVFIHDVYKKNDLREQFCIVINDWLDAMPEADEMLEHDRKKCKKKNETDGNSKSSRQIKVIYLTTEGHRRLVPLVENARLDVVPEFGLEIKEIAGGRLVTLRLNRGDEMLGEILLYQYLGCMEFERNTMEGNRRVHLTPIPYERPHMWLPTMNLLGSVSFFAGRDGSTIWGLKIRFLINLGRKIKHQRHTFIVGDREIPACFDHHVHSAAAIMPYPMRPYVVEQSIATLRSDLLRIIQSDEPYTSPMCWIMKREILRTTSRGYF